MNAPIAMSTSEPFTEEGLRALLAVATDGELSMCDVINLSKQQLLVELSQRGATAETIAAMADGFRLVGLMIEQEKQRRSAANIGVPGCFTLN